MIIDAHAHINEEGRYKTYFEKAEGKISKVVLMGWYKYDIEEVLSFAAKKEGLYVIGSVDVGGDIKKQLERLDTLFEEKKIFGIKLCPGYQFFYPSDKKIYPIAELCQKYNKPLIFHSGDVYNPEKDAILKYAHPMHIDELAVKYRKCTIIISHFGFPYILETANIVSKNDNVYTDISGTLDACTLQEEMEDKLNHYIQDLKRAFSYFPDVKEKTMFGTDYSGEDTPLREIEPYIKFVQNVFTKEEQENVFYKLAESVYGLSSGI